MKKMRHTRRGVGHLRRVKVSDWGGFLRGQVLAEK